MAQTPVSSITAYGSWTDLTNAHDERECRQLLRDDDTIETAADPSTNTKYILAAKRASGEIEMRCFKGNRYTPSDLAALTGVSAQSLIGLWADLTHWHLLKRRFVQLKPDDVPSARMAYEILDMLGEGMLIFGLQETADAGNEDTVDLTTDSNGIHVRPADVLNRMFGQRMVDFER